MDFMGDFLRTKRGHDYVFVVVDRFSMMYILMPCKKTIKGQDATIMFFENVWVHFEIPRSINSDIDTKFINAFSATLWKKMETKLKRYTYFHPEADG